jgi:hypothetical protein
MAAITLQFEVGPETRALIERFAGKVVVEVEFDPETRKVIEEFLRSPYSCRSRSGRRPAVAARCAGTSRRIGAGRGASRITAATSRAGAVTEIVSLATWAAK